MKAIELNQLFLKCIENYHVHDHVGQPIENPYSEGQYSHLIYHKCWIDTVQWHFEDLIRDPQINPEEGMRLKRLIDASNQKRTDIVEQVDDYFLEELRSIHVQTGAKINTESPAWVIDKLSILALKLFHMEEQASRTDVNEQTAAKSTRRLAVLKAQQTDLSESFDQLIDDYKAGKKRMKVYRQMKLYNDPATNPVLYKK